ESIVDIFEVFPVRIHVLSEQRNLLIALTSKLSHFRDHVFRTTTAFLPSCIWNDAISTELITTVHDVYPSFEASALLRKVLDDVAFFGPYFDDHLFREHRFSEQ